MVNCHATVTYMQYQYEVHIPILMYIVGLVVT
jgi:hypothetical protein